MEQLLLTADVNQYDKSVDVLNDVFYPWFISEKLNGYQRGGYRFTNNGNSYLIWFPKMSINGKAASSSNWINTFIQEEDVIAERSGNNPTIPTDDYRFVFAKEGDSAYVFKGIYQVAKDITSLTEHYFKRVAKEVELTPSDIIPRPYDHTVIVTPVSYKRVVFCNTAYMREYRGITFDDKPINGGEYVTVMKDAEEKYNFYPLEDGTIKGFVETKYKDGYQSGMDNPNQIHIENIDVMYKDKDSIENVLVVFCATPKIGGGRRVVGWYDDATVYRKRKYYIRNGKEVPYSFETSAENAHLIKEQDRTFSVPTARDGNFGFGQANIKYIINDKDVAFADKVIDYITNLRNNIDDQEKEEAEQFENYSAISTTEKTAILKQRIGQSRFRDKLIMRDGRCRLCGLENKNLLVASHIKAWKDCANGNERLDVNNGLTLCAIHDAMFDNYLISFDEDGSLLINQAISEEDREILDLQPEFKLMMNDSMRSYMSFHRERYWEKDEYIEHNKWGRGKIIGKSNDGNFQVYFESLNEIKTLTKTVFKNGIVKKI